MTETKLEKPYKKGAEQLKFKEFDIINKRREVVQLKNQTCQRHEGEGGAQNTFQLQVFKKRGIIPGVTKLHSIK